MIKQVIYSRYEYTEYNTNAGVFKNVRESFKNEYNENGIQVNGVSAAIKGGPDSAEDRPSNKTVILLVYDLESETFLKLRFAGRKDVLINRYKVTNE